MEYKKYKAKIVYDPDLEVFRGRVLNTRDVITFQGTSIEELHSAMIETIDEYQQFCEEVGREPEKTYSGKFVVRVPSKLHRNVAELAAAQGTSLNNVANLALEEYVNQWAGNQAQSVSPQEARFKLGSRFKSGPRVELVLGEVPSLVQQLIEVE